MSIPGAIENLNANLQQPVIGPDDAEYDRAREIWNAQIDRRPAIIVEAQGVSDVIASVNFARDQSLPLAIRGGGHNIAGSASTDGGLLLSLAKMRSVHVDPEKRTARVEGGATLGDLDHKAQAFGLATPGGVVSTTGVAGLALGGGFGWLARKYGLTCDNLLSADVVTANGEMVHASPHQNEDLFWAIRGGSGNFGVAVLFEFQLHPIGNEVLFGPTIYKLDEAGDALRNWRDFCRDAPREACVWADLLTAPPLPFLPAEYHGTKILSLLQCFMGNLTDGERALEPLRRFGQPIADAVAPTPYCAAQSRLDEVYAFGARNYWTSRNVTELSDSMIDTVVTLAEELPTPHSDILFCQLGGAIDDAGISDSAYPHRGVKTVITPGARWFDPAHEEECLAWISSCRQKLEEATDGGAYVNFIAEPHGREQDAYGANFGRLRQIKKSWDPNNLFSANQNVRPE